jgi:L-malate glycosyltransferase
MKRLKVMHLVHGLNTGGLENGVVNLCNRLDTSQFAPAICVLKHGEALESRVDSNRVELFEVKRYFGNDPSLPFRLAWQMKRRQIEILHTHSWVTLVEGMAAAKMARVRTVIHGEHGTMEERPRNVRVQRWLWPRAAQITAVSASLADRMAQIVGFSRDRIQVIPNGVDTDRFRPLEIGAGCLRQQLGLPSQSLLIGMVARLVPVKNHAGVFRALASLRAANVEADLALAGNGPLREELQQLARDLQIQTHVHFLGDIDNVECLLNAIDVFVLNSHSEGMSNTILEAMACSIPVVATLVGSNSELVAEGESGYLVPPDNHIALSQALVELAKYPELRRSMRKTARLQIERQFSIQRMVQGYTDLYLRQTNHNSHS